MSLSLNRYRNLDRTDIEAAIKFVQGSLDSKDAPSWIKRFKKEDRKITIKKKKLVYVRSHPGQATYTLNRKNEFYIQLAYVFNFLIKNIDPSYHKALKKHLLQFMLPQRITNYLRCLVNLRFDLAKKIFANLPFGISVMEIFFNYFHYLLVKKSLIRCNNEYIIKVIQKLNN